MKKRRNWLLMVMVPLGLLILLRHAQWAASQGTVEVSGVVVDDEGPVAGATVRQQTTSNSTISAADGTFTLGGLTEGISVTVTAWHEGYHPAGEEIVPPETGITIALTLHPTGDNPDHEWLTSMPVPEDPIGCGHCMVAFPQWEVNAHAQSAINPRFFSLYNGADISGTATVSPGYKLDFPGTAGNCATCHAPGAAVDHPFTSDMNNLVGVETEGVFCDFCHKVANVYLNPATGLPYSNMPGVQSMPLTRPPSDTHMFYGPFDDVTRRVSYLELEKKSQFCAACHQFSFWGTPIYESFREWLESPYPAQGVECQTCHMAPTGVDYFVFPENGGLIRDPALIASHLQPGAADEELLHNTVSMTVSATQALNVVWVTVAVTNNEAGHHVPTDFPGRHMILTVEATEDLGQALNQLSGPTVPEWGGAQAGLPGKAFAKVLRDAASGQSPVVSYWKQTLIVSDNRIPAMQTDTSTYSFVAPPAGGPVTVTAELRCRRAFQTVMDAKGWDTPDVVMEEDQTTFVADPTWGTFFPLMMRSVTVP
ncbi:MAG: hypothetical protein GTO63_24235 [Anaerolineae bacterium]|nr:hypothetical protein [Anaerolineae bacterium]NIN97831.1 hypothetical protein [Anaerolineae bacterium]NIQ80829.1 hypothetical protein [Anaerolineae bacterium]